MQHIQCEKNYVHSIAVFRRFQYSLVACIAIASAGPHIACAQSPPDAGALLKQLEQQQQRNTLPRESEPKFVPPPPLESLGGATVVVKTFQFAGNTLLSNQQLAPSVTSFVNRPLEFTELQNAAIAVASVYRKAGWVVRAYLPQQDVTGGAVTIQIIEGKFGAVHVQGEAKHASSSQLTRLVETSQIPGTPVNAEQLDRALLLIDDLPGVSAKGRLSEGRNQAETDLMLAVNDSPLMSYDMAADNAGARYTGAGRFIADLALNSPFGFGDRGSALLLHSEGSDYGRASYSVPIGSRGLRIGVNGSHLAYDIVTPEFSALEAQGTSTTVGLDANYPLLRSRTKNLYWTVTADDKRFDNESAGVTTTDYKVRAAGIGLYGNVYDTYGGGGANSASITFVQGSLNLDGSPNEEADALTTDTAGSFSKLTFSASRQQAISEILSLYASVSGQFANKNLDSSEKFYLGGSNGVRAYPANEGGGSEGLLLNLEARAGLPSGFNMTGFFDWGTIHVNKKNDFAGATAQNRGDLKGVGVSLAWTSSFGLNLRATLARRIGENPIPSGTGDDQDGSLIKNRFWLQASLSL